jgi:hypothetical protein
VIEVRGIAWCFPVFPDSCLLVEVIQRQENKNTLDCCAVKEDKK